MQDSTAEETPSVSPGIDRTPKVVGKTVVEGAEALVHDVAKAMVDGATAVVNAVKDAGSAVDGRVAAAGSSDGDDPAFQPDLTSEHKAKQLVEQEKLAGYNVVQPEGWPPDRQGS
jgi:hypothetical protein